MLCDIAMGEHFLKAEEGHPVPVPVKCTNLAERMVMMMMLLMMVVVTTMIVIRGGDINYDADSGDATTLPPLNPFLPPQQRGDRHGGPGPAADGLPLSEH